MTKRDDGGPAFKFDYEDGECPICGGEGFVFECFDGFCLDADIGCDDCTHPCSCQKKQASVDLQEVLADAMLEARKQERQP